MTCDVFFGRGSELARKRKKTCLFLYIVRFQADETSPGIWDPMNSEDYFYDILSKPLVRKAATNNDMGSRDTAA